jgi:hypothetical protein
VSDSENSLPNLTPVHLTFTVALELFPAAAHSSSTFRAHQIQNAGDQDRSGHLPKLFDDLLYRLRLPRDAQPPVSLAAATHGGLRFAQGYSASMLVEESRIFQVTTFGTLHLHQSELDQNQVLLDVMIIADEADRQLTETVRGFMTAQAAAA